tara:strand:+ start:69 stop:263 length:195 start_codon:yes stop_codon:yes gene_type:complete
MNTTKETQQPKKKKPKVKPPHWGKVDVNASFGYDKYKRIGELMQEAITVLKKMKTGLEETKEEK